jgi:TPP-dependent pyruvate/acetoin dehydrogenase alpha subunit
MPIKPDAVELSFDDFKNIVINDYRVAFESRQASLLGRREVLTGKAKFGIFGDGKEVAQMAMAKAFRKGDWRAGYYRDQTFMFATGMSNLKEFFAQLYANPDIEKDPASGGRQMNCHYATRFVNTDGSWINQAETMNCGCRYINHRRAHADDCSDWLMHQNYTVKIRNFTI